MRQMKHGLYVALAAIAITVTASSGLAVVRVRQQYYGVCSPLLGFPGILQRAGLLVAGSCTTQIGQPLCSAGTACMVNNVAGKCKNTGAIGEPPICSCVANPTPNP